MPVVKTFLTLIGSFAFTMLGPCVTLLPDAVPPTARHVRVSSMMTSRHIVFFAAAFTCAASAASAHDPWATGQNSGSPNWRGFHVGAQVGAGLGKAGLQRTSGATAGIAAGYNWQSERFVAGFEADFMNADIAAKSATDVYRQQWTATLRARAGVTVGNLLPYITGGPAMVATEYRGNGSKDAWATGWVAGGGTEFYVSRNFSLKGEFLHQKLSKEVYPGSLGIIAIDSTSNVVRGGANYRF